MKNRIATVLTLLCALMLPVCCASAGVPENWPQFRGFGAAGVGIGNLPDEVVGHAKTWRGRPICRGGVGRRPLSGATESSSPPW